MSQPAKTPYDRAQFERDQAFVEEQEERARQGLPVDAERLREVDARVRAASRKKNRYILVLMALAGVAYMLGDLVRQFPGNQVLQVVAIAGVIATGLVTLWVVRKLRRG